MPQILPSEVLPIPWCELTPVMLPEDHPGLLLTNNMMQASKLRDAIATMLGKRKVKRAKDFRMVVDFAIMPDRSSPTYGFNLRLYSRNTTRDGRKPILSIWGETREDIVTDENMLMLLMLYNS